MNVAMNHIFPKTRFSGLHFYRRQYWSSFNRFDAVGFETLHLQCSDAK